MLAEHFGDSEHQVGCGCTFAQAAGKLYADYLRNQHRDWLPKHRGFSLDPADAPTEHAQTIDHGGVRIGADKRIRIRRPLPF